MKFLFPMLCLLLSGFSFANGGAAALDQMMLHHKNGIEKAKAAKVKNSNPEVDKYFDDMILSFEKDLKKMDEMKTRLYPEATPAVSVKEIDNGYDVIVKIPGMNKEDVKVTVLDNDLIISGKRLEQVRQEERGRTSMSSSSSEFVRTIAFDKNVDPRSLKVHFLDDAIQIHIKQQENIK